MFDAFCIPEPESDNITNAIRERAELVKPPLNFQRLCDHVANNLASHVDPRDHLGRQPRTERQRLRSAMIHRLEWALANVLLAHKLKTDQPYRYAALNQCIEFDRLHAKHAQLDEAERQGRVRGGLRRQSRLDPVRRLAAERAQEVLRVEPTLTDWDVARTIEPEVIAFVRQHQLAVVCAENLLRTIVAWIRGGRDAASTQH
jgi:hypothetical protein